MKRIMSCLVLAAGMACTAVRADDTPSQPLPAQPASAAPATPAPPMTRHQMMKDCMAKQKASDGGMPKEEMKKTCKDVTATERENEKTEKKQEAVEKPSGMPQS